MRKPQYTFTNLGSSWRYKTSGLSLGKLCEEHGCSNEWERGQKPRLTKRGKSLCSTENFAPLVVPGLSTGSSSSSANSSSTSLPLDTSGGFSPCSAIQRSDDTHAQASRNRGDPRKTKNTSKNKDTNQASNNRMRGLPDWLEEVTCIKGHTCTHFSRFRFGTSYSSGIREALFLYSLPEQPKLRSLQANQDYEGSLQKAKWRSSTSEAENSGDLITADH